LKNSSPKSANKDEEEEEAKEDEWSSPQLSQGHENGPRSVKKKRERSLGQLCLQFIALFTHWNRELSLEQAAAKLSSSLPEEDHKIKTKVLI
jgi:hypothetical protein